jgi:hypothetical protein
MLELVPIEFDEACAFIKKIHRHHKPPVGHKFSIATAVGKNIVGVITVGRPVSSEYDKTGWILEANRCCTDGTKNACSILYAAAWRAVKAMGYKKMVTYILESEYGASVVASGGVCTDENAGGGTWNCNVRKRKDNHPQEPKKRFEWSLMPHDKLKAKERPRVDIKPLQIKINYEIWPTPNPTT